MSEQPTNAQRRVLRYVMDYHREHGLPPTRAEIAAGLGFASPNAAYEHLRNLARKGLVRLVRGMSRGVFVQHDGAPV